jgi:DNA-binding GntR family transcriptional regulator
MPATPNIHRYWSWHRESAPAKTAVEHVYGSVSADIVDGTLPGGTLITEGEMAERFEVSRTPAREAFLLLEAQGLLRLFPKKGAVVTTPNPVETAQLLQVRVMLESRAVELQTGAGTQLPPAAADLDALIKAQRDAAERADVPAFARADHQFHARVVAGSGNPIIDDFYAQLGPRLARLTCLTVRANTADLQRYVDEHARLASLLAAGDARGYEALLQRHVTGA